MESVPEENDIGGTSRVAEDLVVEGRIKSVEGIEPEDVRWGSKD